jgi:tetratricopeptide (TPR) repeat protein
MLQVSRAVGRGGDSRVEALCNGALARDANDFFALSMLANIYWRSEKYEQALQFALRVLDTTPNDFDALRIAAHAYLKKGNTSLTYFHAKCLCVAKPSVSSSSLGSSNILRPLIWIPKVRAAHATLAEGARDAESQRADWVEWAKAYVLWYESQSPAA